MDSLTTLRRTTSICFSLGDNFGSSQVHRGVHLEVIDGPHPVCERSGSSRSDLGVVGM